MSRADRGPSATDPTTGKAPRRFALRLAGFILSGTALIFLAALGYNYYASRARALEELRKNTAVLTRVAADHIESVLSGAQKVPLALAEALKGRPFREEKLLNLIEGFVLSSPEVFGSTVAYAPYAFDPKKRYFAPYFMLKEGTLRFKWLGGEEFDYFTMDWYRLPRDRGEPLWTEPYYDIGGGDILMASYSVPVFRTREGERTFMAVVTADISLEWLNRVMQKVQPVKGSYAFLVSKQGAFLTRLGRYTSLDHLQQLPALAPGNTDLERAVRDILAAREGFVALERFLDEKPVWLYHVPLAALGWSMVVVIPEEEIFTGVNILSRYTLGIGAAGLTLLSLVIILISERISRPLRALTESVRQVAQGNLEVELPAITANDEIGVLTRSVDEMKKALKEYIGDLERTTAAKERIESELRIARTIQMSFLPRSFPPFPQREEIDLYAALEPAREVGGDFYDFFLLGEDRLFVAIGDVSDKGIAAALFMAVTKTLLKGIAAKEMEPTELLQRVNLELCQENDALMFATVFCGVLDLQTGVFCYTNAGHNPPLLRRRGEAPAWLELPPGLILGVFPEARYSPMKLQLTPGDSLLLYTDGITDALNLQEQAFSTERLLLEAEGPPEESALAITQRILGRIHTYSAGADPADDMALLSLRYLAPGNH
ncbi:MAG TPA: SpoIIE family protein phosphatase [Desulfuromonadales bacterium]|nr:SpoIIE family protein phosphatase [Desulfuromonadales bacterium]